jgi:hypothetical protein
MFSRCGEGQLYPFVCIFTNIDGLVLPKLETCMFVSVSCWSVMLKRSIYTMCRGGFTVKLMKLEHLGPQLAWAPSKSLWMTQKCTKNAQSLRAHIWRKLLHYHVHEGLGVFPVPWSTKWNWSLHLFLSPMFLCPFGLYCNTSFGILLVFILCTCCSHFS